MKINVLSEINECKLTSCIKLITLRAYYLIKPMIVSSNDAPIYATRPTD